MEARRGEPKYHRGLRALAVKENFTELSKVLELDDAAVQALGDKDAKRAAEKLRKRAADRKKEIEVRNAAVKAREEAAAKLEAEQKSERERELQKLVQKSTRKKAYIARKKAKRGNVPAEKIKAADVLIAAEKFDDAIKLLGAEPDTAAPASAPAAEADSQAADWGAWTAARARRTLSPAA